MKTNKPLLLSISFVLLIAVLFIAKSITNSDSSTSSYAKKVGLLPSEERFSAFNYPDFVADVPTYMSALSSARNHALSTNSSRSAMAPTTWQVEGPGNIGGRITCIAIHPTNTNIIFIGTPNGGVFKSTDGGATWNPVFDNETNLSIGSIAFSPSSPTTIYVGTGDPAVSGYPFIGNGIYKSIDGGVTWTNMGLASASVICKLVVHPTNSNIVYAATMGLPMQRDNNRGIYKTIDGGINWTQVKFIDNETGFSDVIMNPANPLEVYGVSWRRIRNTQESVVSGYTSRVYKTIDGGLNWTLLTNGLPQLDLSRYGICMSKQNPATLYVSVCDSSLNIYGIYKTTNSGATWAPISIAALDPGVFAGFGWYFGRIEVNPANDDELYVLGVDLYVTPDGGNTWNLAAPNWWTYDVHADKHDIQFKNANTFLLATDGGLYETADLGINYTDVENLPITQLYRVAYNANDPTEYYGGAQDNGTMGGNISNFANWPRIYGGDGFQPLYDPVDPNTFWVETQNGGLDVTPDGGFSWLGGDWGLDPNDRRNWDMPIVMSKSNPNLLFTGTYKVYKNTTGSSALWDSISGDLTDGIIFGARFHTISAIENSSLNAQHIYAGTSDANVWRTLNNGTLWTNITGTLPNRYVSKVTASPNVLNNVYVTHTGYKANDFSPHIHKSINNGTTWIDISGDLPNFSIFDVLVYPGDENLLFIASDAGVYYTQNGGTNWFRLGNNMPMFPVYDIEFNPVLNQLFAGTFARSIQSIDIGSLTGINTITQSVNFSVYPNPVHDVLSFSYEGKHINQSGIVSVYDVNGKIVAEFNVSLAMQNKISLPPMQSGVYFMRLSSGSNLLGSTRFVKM